MTERWDQVKEVVACALEHRPEERQSFIRQACGADDSLRKEVESLISHHNEADSLLEFPPTADILRLKPTGLIGRQIGFYRILQETAEGGMAIVYLAERADDQFRRRVAIKMVKPGANNREILARFRNERQTLAALDHPNIVKLLDGGSTEEGLPYLVMDYVEGIPIAPYCDDHKLSIRERLSLFLAVCEAVQYAHENGVIHRDLKPGNILVTRDGVPRLLDFGIAKLLNPECLQTEFVTRTGWRAMTPEYASPEQIRGETISALTDVYSLGVVLYELLSGHRPYQLARLSWPEIERLVCESDPESASAVIARTEETVSSDGTVVLITPALVSEARATTPDELRHSLRGDLSTIVMKALSKDPGKRYPSVEALARDIDCFLSGLPIMARRPTLFYRSGKFLRRHRESAVAAVLVFALMAALTVWQSARRWERAAGEQSASGVHIRARPSLATLGFKNLSRRPDTVWLSTAIAEILSADLGAGEQLRTVVGEMVARTKIDLHLSDEESLRPETLALVRKNLGSDFIVLGSYTDSGSANGGHIRLDIRLLDAVKGEMIATVSETGTENTISELALQVGARLREQLGLRKLSEVESAAVTAEMPSNPEATRLYSEGLVRQRSFDPLGARDLLTRAIASDPSFPLAHSALASAWSSLGYDTQAVQEAKKALSLADNLSRENHLVVEAAYHQTSRNWEKAIEAYQTLVSFFPDNAEYRLNLARTQTQGGTGQEALRTLLTLVDSMPVAKDDPRIDLAKADAGSSMGDDKLQRDAAISAAAKAEKQGARLLLARARASECRARADLGENDQAKPACEEARQIHSEVGDRSGLARSLYEMAEIPIDQGDLLSAQKLYEQGLSLARQVGDERLIASGFIHLGVVHKLQGDFVRAQKMYDAALHTYQKTNNSHGMEAAIGNTANVLYAQGKLSEALLRYKQVLALSEKLGDQTSVGIALENMADLLADRGDLSEALSVVQQALDKLRERGQRHYYAPALIVKGQILQQRGELDNARKAYLEARALQQQLGEKGPVAHTDLSLAELNCDTAKPAEAEAELRGALPQLRAEKDTNQESRAQMLLSRALLQQQKLDEAQQAIASALKLSEKSSDVAIQLAAEIQDAYIRAAAKDITRAQETARAAFTQAGRLGFARLQFEASLALGEIQLNGMHSPAGRTRLAELTKTARAKGFQLIAKKALTADPLIAAREQSVR
jgi:serine/threonine protein kinase/tetratricopeptide (TPR) repeat protein